MRELAKVCANSSSGVCHLRVARGLLFRLTAVASSSCKERWGEALDAGFLVVKALCLTDGAMVVLLNILAAWWHESRLPFPSTKTIADRMGVTTRSVQRHLASLEKRGLIRRLRNQAGSDGLNVLVTRYDPAGLVERLKGLTSETYPKRKAGQGAARAAAAA